MNITYNTLNPTQCGAYIVEGFDFAGVRTGKLRFTIFVNRLGSGPRDFLPFLLRQICPSCGDRGNKLLVVDTCEDGSHGKLHFQVERLLLNSPSSLSSKQIATKAFQRLVFRADCWIRASCMRMRKQTLGDLPTSPLVSSAMAVILLYALAKLFSLHSFLFLNRFLSSALCSGVSVARGSFSRCFFLMLRSSCFLLTRLRCLADRRHM